MRGNIRKRRMEAQQPKAVCFICKRVVDTNFTNGELHIQNHNPDTGERLKSTQLGCLGLNFSRLAEPVLSPML